MPSEKWTDEFLDRMRQTTDEEADAVAAEIVAGGTTEATRTNVLFDALTTAAGPVPDSLPSVARDFLERTASLPSWSDPALITSGERTFMLHGESMVATLICSSLPQCYAGADGAQVLYLTGRLVHDFQRRIVETAQFILDVMAPGGLSPQGDGVRAVQKVRLVHAAIRQFVAQGGQWNPAWGQPINQEDLAGTLMAFSTVVLDGLAVLDVKLSPQQQEAYFHAWRVAGHVLGIRAEMLPVDVADGRALWAAIKRRQFQRSEAGVALTGALLDFVHHVIPGNMLDKVADIMARVLMGDETSDMLDVPRHHGEKVILLVLRLLDIVVDDTVENSALKRVAPHFNRKIIEGLEASWAAGKSVRFRIPPSLKGAWAEGAGG